MKLINPVNYFKSPVNFLDFEALTIPCYSKSQYNDLLDNIINQFLNPNDETIQHYLRYTLEHKIAIMALSYEYLGYISTRIILHDIEKLVLYTMIDKEEASKLHRQYSIHHHGNFNLYGDEISNRKEAMLDYECARYTKSDKPANAYCTIQNHFPDDYKMSTAILDQFHINSPINKDCDFEKWNYVAGIYMPIFEHTVSETIKKLKEKFSNGYINENLESFNIYLSNYHI